MNVDANAAIQRYLLLQSPRLRAYLRVLLGRREEAEDALQELFLRYLRRGPPPGTEDASRWLFRVARNLALNTLRGARRRLRREADCRHGPAEPADPAELAGKSEDGDRIRRCLECLATDVRELVYLKVVEDLSYREIGKQTGVPHSTVALRVQEGLVSLSRCFHGK
jgi:RNA polymerase sigma-70 factor (ECF subfamily)